MTSSILTQDIADNLLSIIERAHDKDPVATEEDVAYMGQSERSKRHPHGTGIDWDAILTHLKLRRT